ncbi:MAG: glycerophosphotransferase, partial [Bacteroidetes bacterium]
NPIILYNPHFINEFSSWDKFGVEILDLFYNNPKYNLIFAPHIHLFKARGNRDASVIDKKYFNSPNIHIDLGSEKSVDMTYLKISDLYLGDVSSQVYEFIIIPRPCLFLNPNQIDYKDNYTFRTWKCGHVINTIDNLKIDLEEAILNFSKYEEVQKEITNENFYFEEGSTASQRTAKAIISYLEKVKV